MMDITMLGDEMNITRTALCFALLACCHACNHPYGSRETAQDFQYERLADEMISSQRNFIAALESVQDMDSARNAAEAIRRCANRLEEISMEFGRLGPMSPALRATMLKRLDTEDDQQRTSTRESERVLTEEEAAIITLAAEVFFEKWLAASMAANLDETIAEYDNREAQPSAAPYGRPPAGAP